MTDCQSNIQSEVDRTMRLGIKDVLLARRVLRHWLEPTPSRTYAPLDELTGTRIVLKHENMSVTGAFKIRGSLNLLHALREKGVELVCTASTGNHGLGVARAAQLLGMRAVIAVPEGANAQKVAAIEGFGAEVALKGRDFDESREWITEEAKRREGVFVSTTAPEIIAGAGTYALELLLDHPDLEVIIVPVGGGGGVCGTAIVAKAINPRIAVIGVQSAQAPALQKSWKTGEMATDSCSTYAEGIATRVPFANSMALMRKWLDAFVLVDDEDTRDAQAVLMQVTRQQIEGSSAVTLAAALQLRDRLLGKKTALIMSGGNASHAELRDIVDRDVSVASLTQRIANASQGDVGATPQDRSTADTSASENVDETCGCG